ncbi:hypothetical protein [Helcococcus kunzii]|uniref:hypothetical protein n=2 Tax=Helcococcus kunzii TaxID=40091 RepID=UPI0024AC9332|nr:hypothetical protein [Helcococcus kunzii]
MKNSLKLIKSSISKKSRNFWITLLISSIILLILFFSNSIINLNQERIIESKFSLYGSFDTIIYQEKEEYSGTEDNPHSYIDIFKQDDFIIGSFYNGAENYSFSSNNDYIKNLENDSAIITKSLASKLNILVNDKITINTKSFTIKDIVNDFGYNWIKGFREENKKLYTPNVLINNQTFLDVKKNDNYRITLLDENEVNKIDFNNIKGNYYENKPIKDDANLFLFSYPKEFYFTQIFILFLLACFIFSSYTINSKERYSLYKDLGIQESNLFFVVSLEILIIALSCILLSFTLNILLVYLFKIAINISKVEFNIIKGYSYVKLYIFSYLLAATICAIFSSKIVNQKHNTNRLKKDKIRSLNNILKGKSNLIIYSSMMLIIIYMSFTFIGSLNTIENKNKIVELYGQLKKDYDFQINYVEEQIPQDHVLKGDEFINVEDYINNNDLGITQFYYYNHNNQLSDVLEKLKNNKYIKKVDQFHENYYVYIPLRKEVVESQFFEILDNDVLNTDVNFWKKYFNEENKELVLANIISMPDSILENVLKETSGDADMTTLLNGESGILISPSVNLTSEDFSVENQKTFYWEYKESGKNILRDETLLDYKDIDIYFPKSNENIAGFLNDKILDKLDAKVDKVNLPLISKTYKNIGWFDLDSHVLASYRILVSDKFFEKNSINHEPTRLHVYLNNFDKANEVAKEIYNSTSKIKNLHVKDLSNYLEEFHNFQYLKSLIIVLYIILIFCILIFSSIGALNTYWMLNENYFILFRDLGMTNRNLILLNIKNIVKYFIIFFIIQIVFYYFAYKNISSFYHNMNVSLKIVIQIIPFIFNLIVSYIIFKKRSIELKS